MDLRKEGSVLRYTREHKDPSTLSNIHIGGLSNVCGWKSRGNLVGKRQRAFGAPLFGTTTRSVFPTLGDVPR